MRSRIRMKAICRDCRGEKVRYSSSGLLHFSRALRGTHKRYCLSCGHKWTDEFRTDPILTMRTALGLIAGLLFVYVLTVASTVNLVEWIKSSIRGHYDQEHGKDSTQRLWSDFGGFYGGKGDAGKDYQSHKK